jgi:hypothetical protein
VKDIEVNALAIFFCVPTRANDMTREANNIDIDTNSTAHQGENDSQRHWYAKPRLQNRTQEAVVDVIVVRRIATQTKIGKDLLASYKAILGVRFGRGREEGANLVGKRVECRFDAIRKRRVEQLGSGEVDSVNEQDALLQISFVSNICIESVE